MTMSFWAPFPASLLAADVATAGPVVIRRFEAWGRANTTHFASFAAGVLISVSFPHIVPTAVAMTAVAPGWLQAGCVVMHLLNSFLSVFVCNLPEAADYAIGLVSLIGNGVHSFLQGAIYAIAFKVSLFTGALAAGPVLERIDAETLGPALALSSRALIYVGAMHLLPPAKREPRRFSLIGLGDGNPMAAVIVAGRA